jgi:hypothetical protein
MEFVGAISTQDDTLMRGEGREWLREALLASTRHFRGCAYIRMEQSREGEQKANK